MYAVDLLTDLRWSVAALASDFEAGVDWAVRHLRPSGPADQYRVRPAKYADLDALERGLFIDTGDNIFLWWEDTLKL